MHALERTLGYAFKDIGLLDQALTHASLTNESGDPNNQRLAHLGDAVIELAVREALYRRTPAGRGDLSTQADLLVSDEALAPVAERLNLAMHLRRGKGQTPDLDNPTILSDALEAVFGAIHLDCGYEAAAAVAEFLLLVPEVPGEPTIQP